MDHQIKSPLTRIYRIGAWSSFIAFIFTVGFDVVQSLQLMRVIKYPYDEILIYGSSLCIVIPFLLSIHALHYTISPHKRFWTHTAVTFSIIYAVFVIANYVVQLATVIPMNIQGKGDEVEILSQQPHSLFWNFDAIGYIAMGIAALFMAPAFNNNGFEQWIRLSLFIHALTTPFIIFVYFYPRFSETLLLLGMPWGVTAPLFMLLLAIHFKRSYH